jgi:hypothetical protein
MAGRLDVDPEQLWRAGADLGAQAEQMGSELAGVRATVTGSGNPWGGDEQGSLFGQLYTAALGTALETLSSYVDQVGYAGFALMQHARADLLTDDDAAARFHALGPTQEPP